MAPKNDQRSGKPLVIVESPAKARTISKFLGQNFVIEASIGHIRDLPENKKQLPSQYQQEPWAYLGVNVESDFEPVYVVTPDKRDQVKKLQGLVKQAPELYLATDEDREGEAISWHLKEVLKPTIPVRRMVFHEITAEAIQKALATPRNIDDDLVRAQETRRILDRLYGYDVSQLLWRKMGGIARSAGRVQSVAVRLVVDRERERMRFTAANYWDLLATFAKQAAEATFAAPLVRVSGKRIPSAKDFDASTGQLTESQALLLNEQSAGELADRLRQSTFTVQSLDDKPYTSKPYPPFTTSTLQQEANRKLRFTAKRTMQIAQNLYQNGFITYMRTDSTALSEEAVTAARTLVEAQYGKNYLPPQPRVYATKVKNAQEAHEAIRPAGNVFRLPDSLRGELNDEEFKLYELIWKRTVACQMENAQGRRITITIAAQSNAGETAEFQVGGKTIDFPGYLRAYVEGSDDPQAELADQETVLPDVQVGEVLRCRALDPKGHTTQPPARYTEATLTRTLEQMGIGRPSTYASIIDTILNRNYVIKRGNALAPTWTAMAVINLMERYFPQLVNYDFTAKLEDELDSISRGEQGVTGHVKYLRRFYFGEGATEEHLEGGLKQQVENKLGEIDVRSVCQFLVGKPHEQREGEEPIYVRVGRYGPFLEQGERRGTLPDDSAPDEITLEKARQILDQAQKAEEPLGICPETGKPVFLKQGRFGPYVQRGSSEDEEKPQNASLLKGMQPEEVHLETALQLLSLPRELGPHPDDGKPIVAHNGRYGPYVKWNDESRSLPAEMSPLDVTLDQAIELLAQPKAGRRSFSRTPKAPLKEFAESPVTGNKVQLLEGRYGPYVTDGETNASLPKDFPVDDLTEAKALELLADRAAKGGGKRRKKKAAKKKTAKKKVAKKSARKAAKKTTKKKTG